MFERSKPMLKTLERCKRYGGQIRGLIELDYDT